MATSGSDGKALPKYALVKWVSGEDVGKFSIVSTSWLKGFDPQYYFSNKSDTFVVEWRDQRKPPLGGWACFDAKVINLSDSKTALERELGKVVSLASPSLPGIENAKFPELMGLSDGDDSNDKSYSPSPRALKRAEKEDIVTPTKCRKTDKQKSKSKEVRREVFRITSQDRAQEEHINKDDEILKLREENRILKRRLLEEMPAMMAKMNQILAGPSRLLPTTQPAAEEGEQRAEPQRPGKVELLPGTGVYVDIEAWLSAKCCSTPGAFVGRLLVNLFDKDTLLTSNLKGGASKLAPNNERKKKLDESKIAALRGAMQQLFPGVQESQFGVYVNQKLANMRSAEKKNS